MTALHDFIMEEEPRCTRGPQQDFCGEEGAKVLKERIEAFWAERGHAVTIKLENVGFHPAMRAARFEVRSDMRNGFPPSKIAEALAARGEVAQ